MSDRIELLPLGCRVLVRREREEASPGGIELPESAKEHALMGTVVEKGPDCQLVEIGDKVFFARFSGHEIKADLRLSAAADWDGVMILLEDDILCLVQEL